MAAEVGEVEEEAAALEVALAVDLEQVPVEGLESVVVVVKAAALAEVRVKAVVSVVVREVVGASRDMYLLDKPACYMARRWTSTDQGRSIVNTFAGHF